MSCTTNSNRDALILFGAFYLSSAKMTFTTLHTSCTSMYKSTQKVVLDDQVYIAWSIEETLQKNYNRYTRNRNIKILHCLFNPPLEGILLIGKQSIHRINTAMCKGTNSFSTMPMRQI